MRKQILKPEFFESTWDKITFIGSIVGLIFLIFISFYRHHQLREATEKFHAIQKNSN